MLWSQNYSLPHPPVVLNLTIQELYDVAGAVCGERELLGATRDLRVAEDAGAGGLCNAKEGW